MSTITLAILLLMSLAAITLIARANRRADAKKHTYQESNMIGSQFDYDVKYRPRELDGVESEGDTFPESGFGGVER